MLLLGGIEFGGRVGGAYPISGLARHHSSTAVLGGHIGYSTGRVRVELGYNYLSLPGLQASASRLVLHQTMLSGGYQFAGNDDWGFEGMLGGGYVFAEHAYGIGRETGGAGSGEVGLNFVQHAGNSRLTVGLAETVFIENAGTVGIALSHVFSVRAGVAYAP